MREPTKKEMLHWFDAVMIFLADHGWKKNDKIAIAIRHALKDSMVVTKKKYDFSKNKEGITGDLLKRWIR